MSKQIVAVGTKVTSDVEALLQKYAKEHNLVLEMKSGFSYTDNSVHLKGIIFHQIAKDQKPEDVLTEEQRMYDIHKRVQGLPERGTVFTCRDKQFKIYGWRKNARKNCVLAIEINTNSRYIFPISTILSATK